jgi:hypothetical protein
MRCCANFACKHKAAGLQVPGAHAVDIFFTGSDDKVWAPVLASHEREPWLTTLHLGSQLCNTCNTQLSNIVKDGNITATTSLTVALRARLGGIEYFLSELVPRLDSTVRVRESSVASAVRWLKTDREGYIECHLHSRYTISQTIISSEIPPYTVVHVRF